MEADGQGQAALAFFHHRYQQLVSGATGFLPEAMLQPVDQIPSLEQLDRPASPEMVSRTVCLKLNGGLGTSMGLHGPKSLLPLRDGLTFLDFAVGQVLELNGPAFMVLNSFHTRQPTLAALAAYPGLAGPLPVEMVQSRVPKIRQRDLAPAEHPQTELTWCPPGHGDLYPTLWGSGLLDSMLARGYRWLFASNVDNVGARLEPRILTHFVESGAPLLMEVARRSHEDRKGGHLARLASTGQLILREVAQCPEADREAFQDIQRYRFFNTNNLWLDLHQLREALAASGGFLELPLIVNRKTVDPADRSSEPVFQLESAMGSALSVLTGSQALLVDRSRFLPVKNTSDLLLVRSDLYRLTPGPGLEHTRAGDNPDLELDPRFYAMYDDFEARIPDPPSLREARGLTIRGDYSFGKGVRVRGRVLLESQTPVRLPDGALLEGR